MSCHYNEAFENPDYHFSETLEIDRRTCQKKLISYQPPSDSSHHGSYGEHHGRGENHPLAIPMASMSHGSPYRESLPRVNVLGRSPRRNFTDNLSFEAEPELAYRLPTVLHRPDRPHTDRIPRESEDRWNRQPPDEIFMPSSSLFETPCKEEEKLVGSLARMSTKERIKEIQKMPTTIKKKREIRNEVLKEITKNSANHSAQISCHTECLQEPAVAFRRFRNSLSENFDNLKFWHRALKIIGAEFGTSVLSYFVFLKWLLNFNIFSFLINFSFITIPQFVAAEPNNLSFTGLELFTGAGYFQQTVLYYGFYTNATISKIENGLSYNMQLAYIFTIGIYFVICFLILVVSMAKSFCRNFLDPQTHTGKASRLLCTWDFNITNEKAVKLKQKNLSTQIKLFVKEHKNDLESQAAMLVQPIVVSLLNAFIPFFYSWLGHLERFRTPGHQIYVTIIRNIILKMSIVAILCEYWLNIVAASESECWETLVGQDIYRLLLVDFVFCLLGSFFGEFLRRIIGTTFCMSLGLPEFDIGRNVLDLIYSQTLTWIGILFSPLLPGIQIIILYIVFFVKKTSLMMNCQPPRKVWRTAQMTTSFIFLLFFPSFLGVLCVIGITVWRLKPSEKCGPFRGLSSMYAAVSEWIKILENHTTSKWVVWIYYNLITSELFFFILSAFILIITYVYWQIIEGRKTMTKLLLKQIINEAKDKTFLLEKLQKLQKGNQNSSVPRRQDQQYPYSAGVLRGPGFPPAGSESSQLGSRLRTSEAVALALRARAAAQGEEEGGDQDHGP
ncbi:transmembrane channel-like protein 5 isoform X3 [Calypte anna]|uniref:transmembrane channel-like protein 5 isoform X3 n=1 Tax=Calypte anna TaxID=9244 RepID=UPI0011C38CCD|nr:transmembrane channel-like protein 5 isoform X3 [Calypte anna]